MKKYRVRETIYYSESSDWEFESNSKKELSKRLNSDLYFQKGIKIGETGYHENKRVLTIEKV